ncbi:hypothetical protein [Mucilaginibacter sp. OK098]|uniref:hypothetical protein n=1 Tax=Mucilaginibacter sp. OK098 TaxID=1855297 RepID=UPI0009236C3E|nr:hypothetical protein [Mucilaginibacter sp. OK098]SHM81481.1 hypothetical protein SAMN05216524_103514 [Mucilaginibacter sp. OK098]
MKKKFLQYLFLTCSVMVLLSACRKDRIKTTETLQSGKTFVWVTEAPVKNQFFDVFTDIKTVNMFVIRRDAASNADLQKAGTVTLTALPQSYLDGLGSGYTSLIGTNIYTLPTAADIASGGAFTGSEGITQTATGFTINFAPGEFAKNVFFFVDGSKVDLSKQYAAAYAITNFGGFTKKVGTDTILSTVAIKNKYDGNYDVTGSYTDAANAAYTGIYPYNVDLQTISATANDVYNKTFATYGFVFNTGSGNSEYGSWAPQFAFDPATNKVISVVNHYGQGSGAHSRSAKLDPSGENAYDPGTKTIKVKYIMVSDGTDRCHFDETYTYKGSR